MLRQVRTVAVLMNRGRNLTQKAVAQGHPSACNQLALFPLSLRPERKRNQELATAIEKGAQAISHLAF
jgi:hypothetical protein